ncbi:hypothetical protein B0H15DRAFT_291728 [Mycena belliarum]|uniref:CCHC-type domain-containing protein n=1 Tax=Mycena belliarum TaxID=1033014 RepID=A0AAD6U583_9AGAR|nr:hypothetical protein B0H15DRAFT_291728 [Mycena belliae]
MRPIPSLFSRFTSALNRTGINYPGAKHSLSTIRSRPPRANRSCHLCGTKGHYVATCPLRNFNCGRHGHKSDECPIPTQCHICGSPDHKRTSCPDIERQHAMRCVACGESGHTPSACPRIVKCDICGARGHLADSCPNPEQGVPSIQESSSTPVSDENLL